MPAWIVAAAWGGAPVVTTDDDGVVHASIVIVAPLADAIALLQDPVQLHAATRGSEESALTATPDGACLKVDYRRETLVGTVAYVARSCPTATGMRTELVQSDSFHRLTYEWSAREVPGGVEIAHTFSAEVALAVPDWLVRRTTSRSIGATVGAVAAYLEARSR